MLLRIILVTFLLFRLISVFYLYFDNFTTVREDTWRDYLVSRHIIFYDEEINTGPFTSLTSSRFSSPVYYYVIAPLVLIWDDIKIFFLFNLVLQTLSVIIFYLIANKLFGDLPSFFSALTVIFADKTFDIFSSYWHIGIILPLLLSALLILVNNRLSNQRIFLLISAVLITFAGVIYNSGFIFLAIFLTYILFKRRRDFFVCILASLFLVSIFYLPVFVYFLQNGYKVWSNIIPRQYDTNSFYRHSFVFYYLSPLVIGWLVKFRLNVKLKTFIFMLCFSILTSRSVGQTFTKNVFYPVHIREHISQSIFENTGGKDVSFTTFKNGVQNNLMSAMVWVELEKKSGVKLLALDDFSVENYTVNKTDNDKMVLIYISSIKPYQDIKSMLESGHED